MLNSKRQKRQLPRNNMAFIANRSAPLRRHKAGRRSSNHRQRSRLLFRTHESLSNSTSDNAMWAPRPVLAVPQDVVFVHHLTTRQHQRGDSPWSVSLLALAASVIHLNLFHRVSAPQCLQDNNDSLVHLDSSSLPLAACNFAAASHTPSLLVRHRPAAGETRASDFHLICSISKLSHSIFVTSSSSSPLVFKHAPSSHHG